jgi:hypothetical protein
MDQKQDSIGKCVTEPKETLNWKVSALLYHKKYLTNENTLIDVLKFKNWDKNLDIPEAKYIKYIHY